MNPAKCQILQQEFTYLGHVITKTGISADPRKIAALVKMSPPKNVKQLRSFLGFCNYYRKFVHNFSAKCAPLYSILTRDFQWNEFAQEAFERLKTILSVMPVLNHPDCNQPFIVNTDASDKGLGAFLSQVIDNTEKVIQYTTRSLQPAEKKWCPTISSLTHQWCVREKEALAIIYGCETFRPYLYGTRFIVETDHHSLQWLMKVTTPARLVRCALRLEDALSRLPIQSDAILNVLVGDESLRIDDVFTHQRQDPELEDIIQQLESEIGAPHLPFTIIDNILYFHKYDGQFLIVIPRTLEIKLLELYHTHELSVHMSRDRMYNLMRKRYF